MISSFFGYIFLLVFLFFLGAKLDSLAIHMGGRDSAADETDKVILNVTLAVSGVLALILL